MDMKNITRSCREILQNNICRIITFQYALPDIFASMTTKQCIQIHPRFQAVVLEQIREVRFNFIYSSIG